MSNGVGDSVWIDDVLAPQFDELNNDLSCEVLVIGGGMAGILIAHFLRQSGLDVVVVEGNRIGQGITKNTTAVISIQHDTLYHQLAKKHGLGRARQYLEANLLSLHQFLQLGRDCDLETVPSAIYTMTDKKVMQKEADFLTKLGCAAEFITQSTLPFPIAAGVKIHGMAQFHPLKFLYSLAKDLPIYEKTFVSSVKKNVAYTKAHRITAKHIVVATHFPFLNSKGLYFLKMHQRRSYVLALQQASLLDCTYTSCDKDGLYFRNYKDMLLVGGIDRRVGKRVCGWERLREFAKTYYPNSSERYSFAAQDCVTLDGIPYIGKYGGQNNLYVATGFNEWGMTSSMIAAQLLRDRILGKKNEFAHVFSPQRSMLRGQLFRNIGSAVIHFIKPSTKRCSHLGCALTRNPHEKTWECPCHGSRFTQDGVLIDNPAMKDTKV